MNNVLNADVIILIWLRVVLSTLVNKCFVVKKFGKCFVMDRGQLIFYSHQDQSKWNELILDTLNGVSLKETAAKIDVNERNVFNMRHKLLVSLKTEEYPK